MIDSCGTVHLTSSTTEIVLPVCDKPYNLTRTKDVNVRRGIPLNPFQHHVTAKRRTSQDTIIKDGT